VGKPKAEVAAERVMARVAGVTVTPHFCRIEDKLLDFYAQFHVIILGLDSLEARRFMNQVACSFLGARHALRGAHAAVAARRRRLDLPTALHASEQYGGRPPARPADAEPARARRRV